MYKIKLSVAALTIAISGFCTEPTNNELVKEVTNKYELQDKSELDLTTYELLLENHLNNKLIKSIKL